MRFTTLAALTVLTGAIAIGSTSMVHAQPAPPPPAGPGPDGRGAGPHRPWMDGPGWHRREMGPHRPGQRGPGLLGLMYRPDDRKLTPPEVQKIAEGFLLWFGNRTWKVTEVGPAGDGKIKFAFATADGSVIARFTMDSKTGRVVRTG